MTNDELMKIRKFLIVTREIPDDTFATESKIMFKMAGLTNSEIKNLLTTFFRYSFTENITPYYDGNSRHYSVKCHFSEEKYSFTVSSSTSLYEVEPIQKMAKNNCIMTDYEKLIELKAKASKYFSDYFLKTDFDLTKKAKRNKINLD